MKQILPLYYLCALFFCISCSQKNNITTPQKTYFGGEIINPNSNYVLLFKNEQLIDSITLDADHKFTYQFENFEPGLYTFRHNEYQYLYLEPRDSLFLRVNTIDFDETLTFSGKGSDKNNLLIRTFLIHEKDTEKKPELFSLSPELFNKKINDDLIQRRIALERYADKYQFSEAFKVIANTHISYHSYSLKERFASQDCVKDSVQLPKNYYSFRNNTDLNALELLDFYPYFNYLNTLVNNITHTKNNCKNSFESYTTKLNVIDSIIQNPIIKDNLLKKIGYSYFNKKDTPTNRTAFINVFKNVTNNKELIAKFNELSTKMVQLRTGVDIPNFDIFTSKHQKVTIQDLVNKPTIVYFWTKNQPRHLTSIQEKINQYRKTNKHEFIGICIDDNFENWNQISKKLKLNNNYLIAEPTDIHKKLMLQTIHKTFVLDKNGTILSSSLNLFDPKFSEKLNDL